MSIDAAGGGTWKNGSLQLTTEGVRGNVEFDSQGKPLNITAEISLLKASQQGPHALTGLGTGLSLKLRNGLYEATVAQGELTGPGSLTLHGKNIALHMPTVDDQPTGGVVSVQTLSAGDDKQGGSLRRVKAQIALDQQGLLQEFSVTARDGVGYGPGGLRVEGQTIHFTGAIEDGLYIYRGEANRIVATAVDDADRQIDIHLPGAAFTIRQEQDRTLTTLVLPGNSRVRWGDFTFALKNGEGTRATMTSTPDGQVSDVTMRFASPIEITNAAEGRGAIITRASFEDVQTLFRNDHGSAYLTLQAKGGVLQGTGSKVVFKGLTGQAENRYAFIRVEELQGSWAASLKHGVEQQFGGTLVGLHVRLSEEGISGGFKAKELWAKEQLALVMRAENGTFAEVRFDKTDERYWSELHAGGNLNVALKNGDRIQLENGTRLAVTTQERGFEITGTNVALHSKLQGFEGSASIRSGTVLLGDGPIVIKDLNKAHFRFADKAGQWTGRVTIDRLKDAMLAYGFGDITKGQTSYLALVPKAKGERLHFTGSFHLSTPAGPVTLKVKDVDALEAMLRQPGKNRITAMVRAPSGQGWAELKVGQLVTVRGQTIVLEARYEPFSGYGAIDTALRRFSLEEIYLSQAVVLNPEARSLQLQTPQRFPVLGAIRVLFGGDNPIFRIPGGSRPFEHGPLAPALDLLVGGRFGRTEVALAVGVDPSSQLGIQVARGQVMTLGVPVGTREVNISTSGRAGIEFSVSNAEGQKVVTGGVGVLANVLGMLGKNNQSLFVEEMPMTYWGGANVALGPCQVGGAATVEERLQRWWVGIGGGCWF